MSGLFASPVAEPPKLHDFQADLVARDRARFAAGVKRLLNQAPTGSGKTHVSSAITRLAWEKGKRVLFLAHRRRLIDQKSERLRQFGVPHGVLMAGVQTTPGPVQVASRDTLLARGVRNPFGGLPPADLVIVDEAHNCLAEQYRSLLEHYRDAFILGLTATPAREDGRGLGEYYQCLECSAPVSELVRRGFLVPVRAFRPNRAKGDPAKGLAGDPVSHWFRYADGRPTVYFAAKVTASLALRDAFRRAGVPAEHLDAKTPDAERDRVVADVQKRRVLVVSNVGVWTEGVDVPELSCCGLLRKCGSYVLYAQAVGRVMRSHPSKADAVILDHAGATLEHGYPDEDVEWSLDAADSVDRRNRKAKEEGRRKELFACPGCGLVGPSAPACPACGHVFRRPAVPEKTRAEMLVEADRRLSPGRLAEERLRFWKKCLAVMAAKGQTCGAAAHMYRGRYRGWPREQLEGVRLPQGGQWQWPVRRFFDEVAAVRQAAEQQGVA